jgi:hypothetical protein
MDRAGRGTNPWRGRWLFSFGLGVRRLIWAPGHADACVATCAIRGDRRRWREAKHAAAASCKKDAARTRRRLAIAAVLDEASREEAAKIGGIAWIVRAALDGLGGFFGPYMRCPRIAGDVQAVGRPGGHGAADRHRAGSPISAAEFPGVIEQQRARIAVAVRDLGIVPPVTAGRFAAISQGRNEPVTR